MNRIVSPQELTRYNKRALSALFHQVSQELAGTAPGSEDRRRALTSLENIRALWPVAKTGNQVHQGDRRWRPE